MANIDLLLVGDTYRINMKAIGTASETRHTNALAIEN